MRWFGENKAAMRYQLTRSWLAAVDPQGYATAYSAFATGDAVYADAGRGRCPACS